MSVYINGMEMPESCSQCRFFAWSRGRQHCAVNSDITFHETIVGMADVYKCNGDCPLVPVPPHGDLIDRDKMRETIKPWSPEDEMTGCTFDTVKKLMHTMISRAPTVIPAEESE